MATLTQIKTGKTWTGTFADINANFAALNSEFANYVTSSSLSTTLAGYVTTSALNTKLGDYVTKTGLTSELADYVTDGELTSALTDYVTSEDLTDALSSYVTSSGLTSTLADYLKTTVADAKYVAKVAGKGLSTNDYTTTEKNKLSGIAAGAQVNVIESVSLNGVDATITSKKAALTLDLSGYATTAQLANKVDKVSGKQLSTEDYTTAEKSKLAGIETGAEVNIIESIKLNGSTASIAGKVATLTLDLSGYALKSDISGVLRYKGNKDTIAQLPSSGNTQGDVWFVTEEDSEWAWNGSEWVELGSTFVVPDATTSVKGIVSIGSNINVSAGKISVATATASVLGVAKFGTGLSVSSGNVTLKAATTSALGGIKVGSGLSVTADGTLSARSQGLKEGSISSSGSGWSGSDSAGWVYTVPASTLGSRHIVDVYETTSSGDESIVCDIVRTSAGAEQIKSAKKFTGGFWY